MMWIRSQNNKMLTRVSLIWIRKVISLSQENNQSKDKYIIYGLFNTNGTNDTTYLGEYDTEERAIQVLDEIQTYIQDIARGLDKRKPIVYKMPNK